MPNNLHHAHDGTHAPADSWLKQNIAPLISSSVFQGGGLLIITLDESDFTDVAHAGGHTVAGSVSPLAKGAYPSTTLYQRESTFRLILGSPGMSRFPGAAATARDMTEFF